MLRYYKVFLKEANLHDTLYFKEMLRKVLTLKNIARFYTLFVLNDAQRKIQWNPGLTICQGNVKIISLNRDIVIAKFPV